MRKSIKI